MKKMRNLGFVFFAFLLSVVCLNSCNSNLPSNVGEARFSDEVVLETKEIDKAVTNGEYALAKGKLLKLTLRDTADFAINRFVCERLGVIYYQSQMVDSAIFYWQIVERLDLTGHRPDERAANLSNLGSAYMFKGYYQTAISYFIEAKAIFEKEGEKSENYWINHLNVGVSNMEMHNYDLAEKLFLEVPDNFSNSLTTIKQINLAKLFALQKQLEKFKLWIQRAEKSVDKTPYYVPVYKEVLMEFALQLGWFEVLKDNYNSLLAGQGQASVYYDIMLGEVSILLGYPCPIVNQDQLKSEIASDDFFSQAAFYHFQASVQKSHGNYKEALLALERMEKFHELIENQKSRQDLLDFSLLSERKDIEVALQQQIEQNRLQEESMKAQVYFILALLLLVILVALASVFLFYKQRNKSKLDEAKLKLQEEHLNWIQLQQEDLEKDVKFKNEKLQSVLSTVTKLAVLKKQIDGFFKSLDERDAGDVTFKVQLKRLKVDFNSFFNNYQDLAVIANLEGEDTLKVEAVKQKFPGLNDNEHRVVLFIAQKYTSKEMATLLSCTEKNIEYYRSQIRRKLSISSDKSLSDFFEIELKSKS